MSVQLEPASAIVTIESGAMVSRSVSVWPLIDFVITTYPCDALISHAPAACVNGTLVP